MVRLDILCVTKGFIESRTKSKNLILSGRVSVNGKIIKKPSELVCVEDEINVLPSEDDYVSRGALKLKHALSSFNITAKDAVAVDIGASTGGFSQILLENGAKKIYAVDVGQGQLHPKIKNDKRVISMEQTNARELDKNSFIDNISMIVMDVSFISQTLIYPAVSSVLTKNGVFVSLVKPQFEVGKENIGKGGIVKNEKLFDFVKNKIETTAHEYGLELMGYIPSPITGGDGNKEFLAYFVYKGED